MKEKFNFKRFVTYFKYDLVQMWRNHSKAAILIGGSIAILYVVWVMFSLIFTREWIAPPIEARVVVFYIAFIILQLYQTRTYGYLTEKKAGSAWLMIPASRAEKFVSMLVITLIVIPILFVAVYLILDGFLSLVDPTFGKALVTGASGVYKDFMKFMQSVDTQSPLLFQPGTFAYLSIVSFFCNFLYFLLCGICFKRHKIVSAIAISFAISMALSLIMGFVLPQILQAFPSLEDIDDMQAAAFAAKLLNGIMVFAFVLLVGLGWGIWQRIKTIQH